METRAVMTLTPSGARAARASVFDSDGGAVGEALEVADRDAVTGRQARKHDLACGAALAQTHRALLYVAVVDDEHDAGIAVALHGGLRHEHGTLWGRCAVRCRCVAVRQKRHARAHLRQDSRIADVESD